MSLHISLSLSRCLFCSFLRIFCVFFSGEIIYIHNIQRDSLCILKSRPRRVLMANARSTIGYNWIGVYSIEAETSLFCYFRS